MNFLPFDPAADGMDLNRRERLARRMVLKQHKDAEQVATATRSSLEKYLPRVQKQSPAPIPAPEPVSSVDASVEASGVVKESFGDLLSNLLKQSSADTDDVR